MSILSDRLLSIDASLGQARLPHAFGGAIALAYCTQEPRGTRDIDVNVFVGVERANEALDALPAEVSVRPADRVTAERTGQVRVMWDNTPIDVFLDTHGYHQEAAKEVRKVPFESTSIPILGCVSLVIFKAMFSRTRDWADIEEMIEAGTDGLRALERLRSLLGSADPIVIRLAGIVAR